MKISSINSYSDDHANIFVPQFDRAKLHEKEFYALVALALTEHGIYYQDYGDIIPKLQIYRYLKKHTNFWTAFDMRFMKTYKRITKMS